MVWTDEIRGAGLPAVGFASFEEETAEFERRRTASKTSDATSRVRFIFRYLLAPLLSLYNTEKVQGSSSPGQIGSKVRGFWLKTNASLMLFGEASRVLSAFSPKRVSMNFKIEVWSLVWLSTYPLFA